jgi:hypothetical protein
VDSIESTRFLLRGFVIARRRTLMRLPIGLVTQR